MHEGLLIVKFPDKKEPDGLGTHRFRVIPRVGEYIEKEIEGKGVVFRVVAVIHNGVGPNEEFQGERYFGNVYAVYAGPTQDVILTALGCR